MNRDFDALVLDFHVVSSPDLARFRAPYLGDQIGVRKDNFSAKWFFPTRQEIDFSTRETSMLKTEFPCSLRLY